MKKTSNTNQDDKLVLCFMNGVLTLLPSSDLSSPDRLGEIRESESF